MHHEIERWVRAAELVDLRLGSSGLQNATLHVRRLKQGTPATHPIIGDELRALRRLQREREPKSAFVFTSERGAPFTTAGFAACTRYRRVLHLAPRIHDG
jgi:integrase